MNVEFNGIEARSEHEVELSLPRKKQKEHWRKFRQVKHAEQIREAQKY